VSTFTEISGCFQPGQAKVGPRPTPLLFPAWRAGTTTLFGLLARQAKQTVLL